MKTRLIVSAVAVLAAALVPISVLAAPGDLYKTDFGGSTIVKFAQDGTSSTFASGLNFAYRLAFDGSGNLFVADYSSNTIVKFRPDGTRSTFASGLNIPNALAFDSTGNLFEADGGSGTIYKFTPVGTKNTFASGLNSPIGLAVDRAGNLFEVDNGSSTIFKFTPDGTKSTFASGLSGPFDLAFDSAGNLFEADAGSGTIFIFTPSKFPFVTGAGQPVGLAFEPTRHQFLNVSTRALVGTGDNVLIGGFIMNGNGQVDDVAVVRAIGPSLTAFGVAGALQDPTLELRAEDGTLIATNDNWKTRSDGGSQQALITSTGLAPGDDRESAIYARLPAGHYTTIVRGAGSTGGVAIVEVYNLQ
jgi:hypothetical protein